MTEAGIAKLTDAKTCAGNRRAIASHHAARLTQGFLSPSPRMIAALLLIMARVSMAMSKPGVSALPAGSSGAEGALEVDMGEFELVLVRAS